MTAQEHLEALVAVYQDYLADYQRRAAARGAFHGLRKLFRGRSTADDRKADLAFYENAKQAVADLSAALTEEDGPIAAQAVRYIILETKGSDTSSHLMIEAIQAIAIPLLTALSQEDRAAILVAYQARYPKTRFLNPRQQELLAALKKGAD